MAFERSFRVRLSRQRLIYLYDLLHALIVRELKVQYKRSMLGVAWTFVLPLLQLLIFYFIFRLVLSINIPRYSSFIFSGMLAWTWFQMSLYQGAGSITDNRELIRQPNVPAAVLPAVPVMTNLINFLLALPILMLFIVSGDGGLGATIWAMPIIMAIQFILTLSIAYLVAAFNVTFRDTQHIVGLLLQLFFYLTPVFYDAKTVPARYQLLYRLNPMTHLLEAYRAVLLHETLPDWRTLLLIGVLAIVFLHIGYKIFRRASYQFAEEL